jgi:hypothetical protein
VCQHYGTFDDAHFYFYFFSSSERNSEHAKRSRLRKKSLTHSLQESLEELKEENQKLRNQIYQIFGPTETESMVKARTAAPAERMIDALKNPANKVVAQPTVAFLRSLGKDVEESSS